MLHMKHHIRPKTELLLREVARTTCLVTSGLVIAAMVGECLMRMLASDAFVFVLKAVSICALALAAVHFFLWAIGKENRSRIEELKRLCEGNITE